MRRIVTPLGLFILTGFAVSLFAKGATTKIVITSHDRSSSVVISNRDVLEAFNVWAGRGTEMNGVEGTKGFIVDWSRDQILEKPKGLIEREVLFYTDDSQLAYAVDYGWDPAAKLGYVYIPGRDDRRFGLNVRSIYRGVEGHWLHASREWQELAAALLEDGVPATR